MVIVRSDCLVAEEVVEEHAIVSIGRGAPRLKRKAYITVGLWIIHGVH